MNLFPVNGGLLNGSRLLVVAASAAIACSSAVVAAGVRGQEALSPVSSRALFLAEPTHTHNSGAAAGGTVYAAAAASQARAAEADFDASVSLRAFVFREVSAAAQVLGGAGILAIPASLLGVSEVSPCSSSVLAEATKRQHGRSNAAGSAGVTIEAGPTATRFVVAQPVTGVASVYAETAINGVGESYADLVASGGLFANESGLVTRPAAAAVDCTSVCTAIATQISHSSASAMGGGYAVFAQPFLFIGGLADISSGASLTAEALRSAPGGAAISASADLGPAGATVNHGSSAAATSGDALATAAAVRSTAGFAAATGTCALDAAGLRNLLPTSFVETAANVSTVAVRTAQVEASISPASAQFDAVPDTTIRLGNAHCASEATVAPTADITRYVSADLQARCDATATAVRGVTSSLQAQTQASVNAEAVRVLEAESWALVPWCWFDAVPDVTVRDAYAAAGGFADGYGEATAARMAQANLATSSDVLADADRRVFATAFVDGVVSLRVTPIANPFSFDPESRTFYRQATTTNFVRSASITEFRRPA